MTRIRRVDDLLASNRQRAVEGSSPRAELRSRRHPGLSARRQERPRDTRSVRAARLSVVFAVGVLVVAVWHQRVDRIEVEGLLCGPPDRVHEACSPLLGERWLTVDTAAAAVRLRTEPWFESVEFERRAPSTLVVRLAEARPLYRVDVDAEAVAVDAHGCLLPAARGLDVGALPLLTGAEVDLGALVPGDRERVERLSAQLALAPWPWGGGLERIALLDREEIELTTSEGIVLRLAEDDLVRQLQAAEAAWSQLTLRSGDRVDLRFRRQVILARANDATQGG